MHDFYTAGVPISFCLNRSGSEGGGKNYHTHFWWIILFVLCRKHGTSLGRSAVTTA